MVLKFKFQSHRIKTILLIFVAFFLTFSTKLLAQKSSLKNNKNEIVNSSSANIENSKKSKSNNELEGDSKAGNKPSLSNEQQATLNSAAITTIFSDGFEGLGMSWELTAQNNSGSPGYGYTWFYSNGARHRTGDEGCWCSHYVMFGGNPPLDPQIDPYARGSDAWMTRGPFDFSGTNDGGFEFWYWLDSETNDDQLRYQISTDGTNFYGNQKSGNSGGWKKATMDLKDVPTLGNVCGEAQVWVRIGFVSDTDNNTGEGAYVDDTWLWKQLGSSCTLTVTSPNGGEDWDEKTQQTITWNKSGTCSDVKIEYSTNGGGAWTTIVNNTTNDGSYNWTLPDVSSDKTQCLVKVSCTSTSCSDQSDNDFTIRNKVCTVTVTSPNGGETWADGSTENITWNSSGTSGNVMIRYSTNSGANWMSITNSTPDDGTYAWIIPDVGSDQPNCRVRVEDVSNSSCNDLSSADFTIEDDDVCSITVTAPNGGETWTDGATENIIWTSSNTSGNVKISYSTNSGANWTIVINSTADDGSYSWSLPDVGSDQTNCRVKVEDINNSSCYDESNSDFTIHNDEVCLIAVTAPNGGETWTDGSVENIIWTSSNTSGNVKISYSTNSGANWTIVVNSTADDGSYSWNLPDFFSDQTNCRVKVEDTSNSNCMDISDANFTIMDGQPPSSVPIFPSAVSPQNAGDEFWVDIIVGNTTNPVFDLFAVSFELNFTNSTYLDVVTPTSANVIAGSFLGNDVVFIQNVDETAGKVGIGISRKAGQSNVNGQGTVARVKFTSNNNPPDGTTILFSLQNVTANDSLGTTITLSPSTLTVILNQGLTIWPGDTNNDGIVNQADVLPLGLYWNSSGPVRPGTSLSWTGQSCPKWTPPNATYADANGDGIVNQADVLPIGFNWGKIHTAVSNSEPEEITSDIKKSTMQTLKMNIRGNTKQNQICWVEFIAEDVSNLFGIAFEMLYSPTTYIDSIKIEEGSWLGDDIIFYPMVDMENGKVSFGISRKAGQGGVNGTGSIASIRIKMKDIPTVETTLTLENVTAIDDMSNPIHFSVENHIITSTDETLKKIVPSSFELFQNYPNPFNPETTIEFKLQKSARVNLTIYDINGRRIRNLTSGYMPAGIHLSKWDGRNNNGYVVSSGVYFYQIEATSDIPKTISFIDVKKLILMK
jgi:hypothetical protein